MLDSVSQPALYTGRCNGGPFDGRPGESRYPGGFLLVDKPAGRSWLYTWTGDHFEVQDAQPAAFRSEQAITVATAGECDVRAVPWEVAPDGSQ